MDSPPTPLHPAANEEVNVIPEGALPSGTIANLELNPDLYDNDTDSNNIDYDGSNVIITEDDISDNYSGQRYDIEALTTSFDQGYELLKAEFDKTTNNDRIANYQQSKLINYVDEQLLAIQRKFIKNQAESQEAYSFFQLIGELSKIFDLIWYSINAKSGLFGQQDYLIKLMNDMEDYIVHYRLFGDIGKYSMLEVHLLEFFTFFQMLDLRLSFLIDGFTMNGSNKIEKLNNTQIVRLTPIASRLRILVISKLDPLRLKLSREEPKSEEQLHLGEKGNRNRLQNIIEVEIGRVFEGVLDRT